ncbi:hypothetical protein EON71_00450 [bacterium]|nr:MAG: hypothetical protein EON71_00450 [bacterium]
MPTYINKFIKDFFLDCSGKARDFSRLSKNIRGAVLPYINANMIFHSDCVGKLKTYIPTRLVTKCVVSYSNYLRMIEGISPEEKMAMDLDLSQSARLQTQCNGMNHIIKLPTVKEIIYEHSSHIWGYNYDETMGTEKFLDMIPEWIESLSFHEPAIEIDLGKFKKLKQFKSVNIYATKIVNLPATLLKLEMHDRFTDEIEKDYLPKMLKYLQLGDNFNSCLDNLPLTLTHLRFGMRFNNCIKNIPNSITHLEFGRRYNYKITQLPSNLELLKFGVYFNQDLNGVLPSKLKRLELSVMFNQELKTLPNSLELLSIGYITFENEYDFLANISKRCHITKYESCYEYSFPNLPESLRLAILPYTSVQNINIPIKSNAIFWLVYGEIDIYGDRDYMCTSGIYCGKYIMQSILPKCYRCEPPYLHMKTRTTDNLSDMDCSFC